MSESGDEIEKVVEHHWHDPDLGQVNKALRQYFHDNPPSSELIQKVIEDKVSKVVDKIIWGKEFKELVIQAVAHFVKSNAPFKESSQWSHNYQSYLSGIITDELRRLLIDKLKISIDLKCEDVT